MYIDAHTHCGTAKRDDNGRLIPPLEPDLSGTPLEPAEYVRRSREDGLESVLLLDPPHVTFEVRRVFGDFVIPVPQVDLDHTMAGDIDALFEKGARGIKFIAPGKPYNHDDYLPIDTLFG